MCVVTLMKNGICTFRQQFAIAEMGHWLEKMITDFAEELWLCFEILGSVPHMFPGTSWAKSNFVGWTLKYTKIGSACQGFVSLGKHKHTNPVFWHSFDGRRQHSRFFSFWDFPIWVPLPHPTAALAFTEMKQFQQDWLLSLTELWQLGWIPSPVVLRIPICRWWPCSCLCSTPRTLRQNRKGAPRGPSLWLCHGQFLLRCTERY